MKFRADIRLRPTRCMLALLSTVSLVGCVSSAIDTPPGFVSSLEQPTAADVLSLSESGELPTPESRPSNAVAASAPAQADAPAQPTVVASAAAEVEPTITPTAQVAEPTAGDVATQRIQAAENAPTANASVQTPATPPTAPVLAQSKPRPTGLLSALFGNNSNQKPPAPVGRAKTKPVEKAKPVVVATARSSGSTATLPGVSKDRALGVNNDSTTGSEPVQVASAAGLGRLTPNGLKTQHAGVDVKCFKPALVRVLKTVERKFGKPVIVTSGYRSPARNKRARGAKNSLHIYCAAADIQVSGVSKWTLAKYLRSMPGRGGVGTYCHTKSVHVDIGPKRDWNWRCRRKK